MKKAKHYILLILLLLAGGWAKAQQWKELHTGVDEPLFDIGCIDTNNVLACGPNGLIVKTKDGGQTWEQKDSNTEAILYLLKFADEKVGFACGDETLLKTTDGGESWINVETNPEMGFHYGYSTLSQPNLFLVDADTIYVTDSYNNLWKSINCGESFEKALDLQDTTDDFYKFDLYFEDNVGYLVGYETWFLFSGPNLKVFKTMDYGKTWEIIEFTECESMLSAVHFMDKDHIRLYGYFSTTQEEYYGVLETTDGMGSYSLLMPVELEAGFPDPRCLGEFMAFSSEYEGCLVYSLTAVKEKIDLQSFALLTHDNGETWTSVPDGINWRNHLYAVDGVDTVFYIAAEHGYVYKTGIADVIYPYGVDESISEISVFPNPASEMIHIEGVEAAEVRIYNAMGQLSLRQSTNGNDQETIDISSLPNGIYLIQLVSKGGLATKQIVKIQ